MIGNKLEKYDFTAREMDFIPLLRMGISNADMAKILCIEHSTVKAHLGSIYKKLGVVNKTQAVAKIFQENIIPHPDSKQP